jgi:S-adenosylmethionine:tRNA ribosyltransferase-isomerase
VILTGTHEPDSSHYQLLRAFAGDDALAEAGAALEAMNYRTHEFGDSMMVERRETAHFLRTPSPEPESRLTF